MNNTSIIKTINTAYFSRKRCIDDGKTEFAEIWDQVLSGALSQLPRGSGFDCGTKFIPAESVEGKKLVFRTSFHHMDQQGGYDGWTDHKIIVTPSFDYVHIRITGRNENGIKDYIAETFDFVLTSLPCKQFADFQAPPAQGRG